MMFEYYKSNKMRSI